MASLKITELDFDDIKTNLKTFLKSYTDENGNQVFSDYEFEGSSLSVLIDLLAYNRHYNVYYMLVYQVKQIIQNLQSHNL